MNVSTRCRMCWTECGEGKLISMLTVLNDSINLWTMYDYIMDMGEYFDVAAIPHICIKCENDLTCAYTFKLMCSETERTLSNELGKGLQEDNESEVDAKIEHISGSECEMDAKIEQSGNESDIEYLYFDEVIEYDAQEDADNVENDVKTVVLEVDGCNEDNEILFTRTESIKQNTDHQATNKELNCKNKNTKRKCRSCNIQFESLQEYKVHYREHHQRAYPRKPNNNPVNGKKCTACNIQFKTLKEYSVHYRRLHARKRPSDTDPLRKVVCPHCGKLIGKKSIGKHINLKHSTVTKSHECNVCGKSFGLRIQRDIHTRIHTNDKRWECKECGEMFLHWASRKSHIRIKHTFEKAYECHLCGQKFTHNSNLHRHIRRHNNDFTHCCTLCPKAFMTKVDLANHQIVHTKDKNEICEICLKGFGTQKNLKAHLRIHSGERNYVCWVCDKRFTQPHVLRTHLKTHAGVEMPERGAILSQKALSRLNSASGIIVVDKEK